MYINTVQFLFQWSFCFCTYLHFLTLVNKKAVLISAFPNTYSKPNVIAQRSINAKISTVICLYTLECSFYFWCKLLNRLEVWPLTLFTLSVCSSVVCDVNISRGDSRCSFTATAGPLKVNHTTPAALLWSLSVRQTDQNKPLLFTYWHEL